MENTVSKRNQILQDYFEAQASRNRLLAELSRSGQDSENIRAKLDLVSNLIFDLSESYLSNLPVLSISRCPYTGQLVHYTVDTYGLGGPWWDYLDPVRKSIQAPATFFAVDGAMKITASPETAPFLVIPGPDQPFVIPGLLQRREIKAVISSMKIAGNLTWWIVYYAFPMINDVQSINDYGTNQYSFVNLYGHRLYESAFNPESAYDYSLEKWIRQGKLLWIAPDDETFKLQAVAAECPYLGIAGSGHVQIIRSGKISYLRDVKMEIPEADDAMKQVAKAAIQQINSRGDHHE